MMQMVAEHKSLWRIKNMYKKDAAKCKECMSFWEKLEKDKENHIKELSRLIKQHME
jgi:hypothetical protein